MLERRPLGSQGLMASQIGLGAMGMTAFYDVADPRETEAESLAALDKAAELGVTLIDTAWVYQHPSGATNEALVCVRVRARTPACCCAFPSWRDALRPSLGRRLRSAARQVGKALKKHGREKFVVATKFGLAFTPEGGIAPDCRPATIRAQLADSLARLGTDYIDLYYAHRIDPKVPIEEMMGCLKAVRACAAQRDALLRCTCAMCCPVARADARRRRSWWRRARCALWGCRSARARSCGARTRCTR